LEVPNVSTVIGALTLPAPSYFNKIRQWQKINHPQRTHDDYEPKMVTTKTVKNKKRC
jgi:hypothetical protein